MQKTLRDLANWKPAKGIGEQTVRSQFIDPLLWYLGYDAHEDYQVWRDGDQKARFRLNAPPVHGGAQKVQTYNPDYVPTVRKTTFWVMDAKRPGKKDQKKHVVQVLQYAVHPEIQARYGVLIDGLSIRVYDVRRAWFEFGSDIYTPILEIPIQELECEFEGLRKLLGNEQIRDHLVDVLADDYRKLCEVSLDEHFPDIVLQRLIGQKPSAVRTIQRNKALVYIDHLNSQSTDLKNWLASASTAELVEACGFPDLPIGLNPGEELARRVMIGTLTFNEVGESTGCETSSLFVQHQYILCCAALVRDTVAGQDVVDELLRLLRGPLSKINEHEAALIRLIRKVRVLAVSDAFRDAIATSQFQLPERQRAMGLISTNSILGPSENLAFHQAFRIASELGVDADAIYSQWVETEKELDASYRAKLAALPNDEKPSFGMDTYGWYEPRIRWNLLYSTFGSKIPPTLKTTLPQPLLDWFIRGGPGSPLLDWMP